MRILKLLGAALVVLACGVGTASATDVTAPQPQGAAIDGIAGLALALIPDYEGSDDYRVVPVPGLIYNYWEDNKIILRGNQLFVDAIAGPEWDAGLHAIYRFGRDDDVDDSVVKLMEEVDDSFELGAFVGYTYFCEESRRNRWNTRFDFTQDVSDGHDGFQARLETTMWMGATDNIDVGLRGFVTYADSDYMSAFFDVSAADSAVTGLPTYGASSGLKDFQVGPIMLIKVTDNWYMGLVSMYKRLLNDAEDSPVVDIRGDADQFIAGIAGLYAW